MVTSSIAEEYYDSIEGRRGYLTTLHAVRDPCPYDGQRAAHGVSLEMESSGTVRKQMRVAQQSIAEVSMLYLMQRGTTVWTNLEEFEHDLKREFRKALALLKAYALRPCCMAGVGVQLTVSNQIDNGYVFLELGNDIIDLTALQARKLYNSAHLVHLRQSAAARRIFPKAASLLYLNLRHHRPLDLPLSPKWSMLIDLKVMLWRESSPAKAIGRLGCKAGAAKQGWTGTLHRPGGAVGGFGGEHVFSAEEGGGSGLGVEGLAAPPPKPPSPFPPTTTRPRMPLFPTICIPTAAAPLPTPADHSIPPDVPPPRNDQSSVPLGYPGRDEKGYEGDDEDSTIVRDEVPSYFYKWCRPQIT
ncbi:hypothetical protein FPV67DRAFT_1451372 [Lyophyllum atratum]|nr:hypothetical protein FPV67DRAFT_1451372 [Lyophyllum atratum]